jgi:hypothetical protein
MKLISRILIILVAAAVVAGIAVAIANISGAAQSSPSAMRPPTGEGTLLDSDAPRMPGEHRDGQGAGSGQYPDEGERGRAGFGPSGLLKNLGIIAAIVIVYSVIDKLFALRRGASTKTSEQDTAIQTECPDPAEND